MPVNESAHIYHTWVSKLSEMFPAPPPAVDIWWESFIIFKSFKFRELYPRSWSTVEWLLLLLLLLFLFLLCPFLVGCGLVYSPWEWVTTSPRVLQSWTKMLRKMHVVCRIWKYFPLKPSSLKILPPPPPKNNVEVRPEHFYCLLNNIDQGGVGGGVTMVPNSQSRSPVCRKEQNS